jgi:hypothetical protein
MRVLHGCDTVTVVKYVWWNLSDVIVTEISGTCQSKEIEMWIYIERRSVHP